MANNNYFDDLNKYVENLNNLNSTLYEDKINVNEVDENLINTHVTAEDLNQIKETLSTLIANVNDINSHLINAKLDSDSSSNTNNTINNGLNAYLANEYIRKNQLIIDNHNVNDSVEHLDDVYLRSKNIFVDGYKISTTSPYNLVSLSQLNLVVDGLSTSWNNVLEDIKTQINNWLINEKVNYQNGRFINIDDENKINCLLNAGSGIDINETTNKISIKPSQIINQVLSTNASKEVVWASLPTNNTGYNGGTYITVDNYNNIHCMLAAGNYIIIDNESNNEGKYLISVVEGTTEQKGVVQLVSKITEENKNSDEFALTPAALMGIEEHIFFDQIRDAYTYEPAGTKAATTMGWIKYPNQRSTKYPGMCLAIAWGWTGVITMSDGLFEVPITNAYQYPSTGTPYEVGTYCIFHRIVHTELGTIAAGDDRIGVNLTYRLAFGPPTEDGTDIKGITTLLVHAHPVENQTTPVSFQVYWKVYGYVHADGNEVWPSKPYNTESTTAELPVLLDITISPTPSVKTKVTDFATESKYLNKSTKFTDDTDALTVPIGYLYKHVDSNHTSTVKVTYTLTRLEDEKNGTITGKYKLHNIRTWIMGHLDYNYAGAIAYADFDGAQIDLVNNVITNIKILRATTTYNAAWTRSNVINSAWFDPTEPASDPEKQFLHYAPYTGNATQDTATRIRHWNDCAFPHSNSGRTLFKITVTDDKIQIKLTGQGYYQHEAYADAEVWHSPKEDAFATFVQG